MGVASVLFGGLLGFVAAAISLSIFGANWQTALLIYFGSGIAAMALFLGPIVFHKEEDVKAEGHEDQIELWKRELGFREADQRPRETQNNPKSTKIA